MKITNIKFLDFMIPDIKEGIKTCTRRQISDE